MLGDSKYPSNVIWGWCPSDTEEQYHKNPKHWYDMSYKFNEYGFRSDPFTDTGNIFLGCSNTLGIGLPYENTWPYLVSRKLNQKCWNLGQGGKSNDTCYRLAEYWIPRLQPKSVFFFSTFLERREFVYQDQYFDIRTETLTDPNNKDTFNLLLNKLHKMMLLDQINDQLNLNKNVSGINWCAVTNQAKFYHIPLGGIQLNKSMRTARDNIHWGPKAHQIIAEHFLDLVAVG